MSLNLHKRDLRPKTVSSKPAQIPFEIQDSCTFVQSQTVFCPPYITPTYLRVSTITIFFPQITQTVCIDILEPW